MSYKIYSIIVTYNAMKWIEKCLSSLFASETHTDIVIVDNCSSDKTVSFIEKNYPDIHVIINDKNRGFGQANNQGIEYAYSRGATHFFLCNQDLYIKPDTIKKMIAVQEKFGLAIVSPLQMNGSFNIFDQSFYNAFVKNNNRFVSDLICQNLSDYYETSYVPAAAWLISKECIESIGGFDPLFFHYSEDGNYINRLHYHNKKLGVVPDALVAHDRVFKGNINAYNKYSPLSTLFYYHANPSYTVFTIKRERVIFHLVYIKNIFKLFLRLEIKKGSEQFVNYIKFWTKLADIKNSIRTNRNLYHNWLNINCD